MTTFLILKKIRSYKCCITIDMSERIDLAKSGGSKECMVCHYWFFNHGFKYQDLFLLVVMIC